MRPAVACCRSRNFSISLGGEMPLSEVKSETGLPIDSHKLPAPYGKQPIGAYGLWVISWAVPHKKGCLYPLLMNAHGLGIPRLSPHPPPCGPCRILQDHNAAALTTCNLHWGCIVIRFPTSGEPICRSVATFRSLPPVNSDTHDAFAAQPSSKAQ